MNKEELSRIEGLMRKRDLGIPSDPYSQDRVRMELADEVPGLVAAIGLLNLQIDAIRMRCGRICDESSAALGHDQTYWGARLRCAQEISQVIDAKDTKP